MILKEKRLPAYPLMLKDPFFSLWCAADDPSDSEVVFWHGEKKPFSGILSVNGENYRFLGRGCGRKLKLDATEITAFGTIYHFSAANFSFSVEFLSPLPPDDLDILSLPVTIVNYVFRCPKKCDVKVRFSMEERAAYNTCFNENRSEPVRVNKYALQNCECISLGLLRQMPLSHSLDEIGADWGYMYLAGKNAEDYVSEGRQWVAVSESHNSVCEASSSFFVAFDDVVSIFYYGEYLKNYWQRDGKSIFDALEYSVSNKSKIKEKCAEFDRKLIEMSRAFSEDYLFLLYASLRQSIGAHKLVQNAKGEILFLSKECNSDGCIATVDISYPSMPLYLLFNPVLVKGMLVPIFDFARMPVWKEDFAPHDSGVYPYCLGQYYAVKYGSGGETFDMAVHDWKNAEVLPFYYQLPVSCELYEHSRQMPVEECGNVLVISWLYYCVSGDDTILSDNFDLFEKWVRYLVNFGLIPSEQLCTDDFAGHSDKNANLAVKAIVGIDCFAHISEVLGKEASAEEYRRYAKDYAEQWISLYDGRECSVLAIGQNGSFSLKYNMAIDVLLGSRLFPQSLIKKELAYYEKIANRYGAPLDSRNTYTKTDWLMWCASMGNDEICDIYAHRLARYLSETESRVPFSDWIDSAEPKYYMFRNRSVQGGNFMPLLRKYWYELTLIKKN